MLSRTEAYGLTFIYPTGDTGVGQCLRDYGEFGRIGWSLAAQMCRGGSFIDVGANIGGFALPVSPLAHSVVAIEASPAIAAILSANVAENHISNVNVINAVAGNVTGEVSFPALDLGAAMNFGAVGLTTAAPGQVRVPAVRLDDIAPEDTRVVKIDVEGAELDVLRGASQLLKAGPAWIIEAADSPASREVIALLASAGYSLYWLYDAFVTPQAPKARWTGRYRGDLNIFAVPAGAPEPVGMVEVVPGQPWPTTTAGFQYLRAFGIMERQSDEAGKKNDYDEAGSAGAATGRAAAESSPAAWRTSSNAGTGAARAALHASDDVGEPRRTGPGAAGH
jgi:FkbM family methyltransferase